VDSLVIRIPNSCLQVLPLSEESRADGVDDLLKQDDVRVEVMRARGAGGQVSLCNLSFLSLFKPLCLYDRSM
jgi:protein subunit release factor A